MEKKATMEQYMEQLNDTEIKVRYAETDQMGIVHHSVYPVWFEAGRTDFMEKLGYPYSRLEAEGVMTPLTKLNCSYMEGARYGDTVIVSVYIKKLTFVKIEFFYKVRRKSDMKLLATGETTLACTDRTMRIINLKAVNPDLYKILETESARFDMLD